MWSNYPIIVLVIDIIKIHNTLNSELDKYGFQIMLILNFIYVKYITICIFFFRQFSSKLRPKIAFSHLLVWNSV